MQTLLHATRAFIFNASGLPNFLVAFDISKHLDILKVLKQAEGAGELEQAMRW